MKTIQEIQKEQSEYGREENEQILLEKTKFKRKTPQISITLDQKSIDFINSMAIYYSSKKRKLYNQSKTLRILLKYCRDMEHELQEYI